MKLNYKYQNGLYYPDLKLPETTHYPLHKYGNQRLTYLKKHRRSTYTELLVTGKLNEHLHETEVEAHKISHALTVQMKREQGVTEELKAADQMEWVRRMNNIKQAVDEYIFREVICV